MDCLEDTSRTILLALYDLAQYHHHHMMLFSPKGRVIYLPMLLFDLDVSQTNVDESCCQMLRLPSLVRNMVYDPTVPALHVHGHLILAQ